MKRIIVVFFVLVFFNTSLLAQKKVLEDYNISWNTPGVNSQGSMPLGNGDIGVNAWIEENGDLVFYVSKTDAWNEYGHLLKLGKIRVSLSPNQYSSKSFLQTLELEKGCIVAKYGTAQIKLWVDANNPTIQIDIDSKNPLKAQVFFETWRKTRNKFEGIDNNGIYGVSTVDANKKFVDSIYREADTILHGYKDKIISCHHNSHSQWKNNLELQALGEFTKTNTDPILNRTYGIAIESKELVSDSDTSLISKVADRHFQINVYPLTKIGTVDSWKDSVLKNVEQIQKIASQNREKAHNAWWKQFWNRNYIFITSKDSANRQQAETVTQGYILQHFINACGGRGNSPIKFNGSIFTVDTYNRTDKRVGADADFRLWGGAYWWQNTRFAYWSMLTSGDFEMMEPLFKMYMDALPLRKVATKKYYNHEGAFFPETMNFWGTYTNTNYGSDRKSIADGYITNNFIRYYWQGGLEFSLMMLDYYSFTNNNKFAKDSLVPFVAEILSFFDNHWQRAVAGKIVFFPATGLETYQTGVKNPLPEIVGIKKVAEKMLALPDTLITKEQRNQWEKLIKDLPEIPTRVVNNETLLAPASEYGPTKNVENPELYAVFPYRTFGIGKANIDLAKRTFAVRIFKQNGCWTQNSIQAAYLGLTDEVKKMVVKSFSVHDSNFRFPAFWGPNYDWTPDQDHGCAAMIALQRMIIQYEDNQVSLLPAWPKEWDVRFKVSGPNKTIIEGTFENGKMSDLKIAPKDKIKIVEN
jgi:alpha-L-fucosidase 2